MAAARSSRRGSGSAPAGPSQRQLRVGEQIKHMLADELSRGNLHHPDLKNCLVTITEVRSSPDLRHATVYTGIFGASVHKMRLVLDALNEMAPQIQGTLGRKLAIKFTPRLHFKLDDTLEEADHINRLLNSKKVRQDLNEGAAAADEAGHDGGYDSGDEAGSDAGSGAGSVGRA